MSKLKVAFVHPNFQQGPRVFNAYYLPYTAGVLWAYAQTSEHVREHYELGEFIWRRDDIEQAVEQLGTSDVIAFCTYVWNRNYNYALARAVRARWPNKFIVFGGPEPAIENPRIFDELPFADVIVCQEGEHAFRSILEHDLVNLDDIPGLLINRGGQAVSTGASERMADIDLIPSPYLLGLFDRLVRDNPGVEWSATLESNRGCPYQCTFCDWGSLTYNKVKKFDITRVLDELEWMGRNHCGFITIADANFGMFLDRDMAIAEKIIDIQSRYGWPKSYTLSWAKNQKDDVIKIAKRLVDAGHTRTGLNLSVQTLDPETLHNIKRRNLAMNKIEEVFKLCDANNIPLYTELILGMPGETLKSWKQNFYQLYAAGNHTGLTVYQAQLLENAEMNLVQRRLYKIEGQEVYDYYDGPNNFDHLEESIEIVTATNTMPRKDLLAALEFSWFHLTAHVGGLTTYIARVLNKRYAVSYEDFYNRLYEFLLRDLWFRDERDAVMQYYQKLQETGRIDHDPIMGVNIFSVNLFQRTIIRLHAEDKLDHWFKLVEEFVRLTYGDIDARLVDQLLEFQRMFVIEYQYIQAYPRRADFDYDFVGYLVNDTELECRKTFKFAFPENSKMSLTTFCEQIFFARRKNFGKAVISYEE